jgi:hypothetical protein
MAAFAEAKKRMTLAVAEGGGGSASGAAASTAPATGLASGGAGTGGGAADADEGEVVDFPLAAPMGMSALFMPRPAAGRYTFLVCVRVCGGGGGGGQCGRFVLSFFGHIPWASQSRRLSLRTETVCWVEIGTSSR